ncbi:hypothetical protein CDO44_25905 [Pigmentiphaga sp. NML080357]|uniref:helix-turn-helix domain-containing protein n=1 Tax=Pigmentiphaga sp. NML080357 TaxID=2008675 RepID=UPI000B40FA4B|nr:helix-turn-helix domain-containing protein [Pigmentiphaga sp. NML080357]OVZ54750.1 hypothetical protein CDO44_25905 [Pigmentiphaga sp. NML080357]
MIDTNLPEIAVLLGETGRDYDIANELMRTGFIVYVCTSTQEVHALMRAGKLPVILADARQAAAFDDYPLPRLVYVPRTADAATPAGRQATGAASGVEVRVMGSDARVELTAILRTMRRHLDAPMAPESIERPVPAPAQWRLSTPPRRLIGPGDQSLPLTLTEWQFVSLLFMAPNRVLTFAQWQAASVRDGQRQLHNVAVLVSRLRRKAARHGIKLPLEAVRGVGYAFTEPCARVDTGAKRVS